MAWQEQSNQSLLQRLRNAGILGNNELDPDLLLAKIQFNNLWVCGTQWRLLPGTCAYALVVTGGVPL